MFFYLSSQSSIKQHPPPIIEKNSIILFYIPLYYVFPDNINPEEVSINKYFPIEILIEIIISPNSVKQ